MTMTIWALICGLFILLALEIRNQYIFEELAKLRKSAEKFDKEIERIDGELKMKKSIYDEDKGHLLR